MTTIYDVPADKLIEITSVKLSAMEDLEAPDWSKFVKTGVHKEKAPTQENWWFIRMASILRRIYIKGPIGVSRLRGDYGGKKRRGAKRSKAAKGSGKIIRVCLQDLEKVGLIKNVEEDGRIISPKGQSFLDNNAHEVLKTLVESNPELGKY